MNADQGSTSRRHRPGRSAAIRIGAVVLCGLCLAAALAPAPALAQKRTYTMDEDPLRRGDRAFADGDLAAARTLYEEAVANGYKLPDALTGLARLDLAAGDVDAAADHARQALAAAGGRQPLASALLGVALLRRDRAAEAREVLADALAADSKLWEAHYGQARLLMDDGRWDEAARQLEHGAKVKGLPAGEDLYQYGLALYLRGTGDLPGAERAATLARHLNPHDPAPAVLLARIYEDEGLASMAAGVLEEIVSRDGEARSPALLHELGRIYAAQNRFNDAAERYRQAVQADSTYTPALEDLGRLYVRAKRPDLAAGVWTRLAALRPDDAAVQMDLASALDGMDRPAEALAAARRALALAPDDQAARFAVARAGLQSDDDAVQDEAVALALALPDTLPWPAPQLVAVAAKQAGRGADAAADSLLDLAARVAPDLAAVPFQRGLLDLRRGRTAAAVADFTAAVALEPDNASAHLNLGIARYQDGDVAGAVPDFRRAVELRDDLVLARLLLAQALAATGAMPEARAAYEAVLAREPDNAKALRGVGFCRLRAADYAGAAESYAAAARAEPDNADGWAGLGTARLGRNDLTGAEEAFARARALDPDNTMLKTGSELLAKARNNGKEE